MDQPDLEEQPSDGPLGKRYTGTTFDRADHRWRVRIQIDGKQQHVGRFKDPEEAARAYDRAAVHLHGMEVVTNFPAEEALANGTPMAKPLRLLLERFKDRLQIPLPPSICGSEDSAVTTMGGGRSRGGSPSRGKRGAGLAGAPPSRREPSKRGRQSAELSSKSWSGAAGLPDAASLQQQHVGMPPHPHQQQLQRQLLQRCSSAPAAVQAGLRTLMQGAGGNASVLGAHNLAQFEWMEPFLVDGQLPGHLAQLLDAKLLEASHSGLLAGSPCNDERQPPPPQQQQQQQAGELASTPAALAAAMALAMPLAPSADGSFTAAAGRRLHSFGSSSTLEQQRSEQREALAHSVRQQYQQQRSEQQAAALAQTVRQQQQHQHQKPLQAPRPAGQQHTLTPAVAQLLRAGGLASVYSSGAPDERHLANRPPAFGLRPATPGPAHAAMHTAAAAMLAHGALGLPPTAAALSVPVARPNLAGSPTLAGSSISPALAAAQQVAAGALPPGGSHNGMSPPLLPQAHAASPGGTAASASAPGRVSAANADLAVVSELLLDLISSGPLMKREGVNHLRGVLADVSLPTVGGMPGCRVQLVIDIHGCHAPDGPPEP